MRLASGLAHVGIRLVPIQSAQLQTSPVEIEVVGREAAVTEADAYGMRINTLISLAQVDDHVIELWVIDIPKINCCQAIQSEHVWRRAGAARSNVHPLRHYELIAIA